MRSILGTIGIGKICQQWHIVMIFLLSIFINLKDGFWLAIIKKGFLDKKLSANPEFDTSSNSSALTSYEKDKIETMLGFINKDRLAYMAWARI